MSGKRTKRTGNFSASEWSTPSFTSERPKSFEEATQDRLLARANPGEVLLRQIDQIVENAQDALSSVPGPADLNDPDSQAAFAFRLFGLAGQMKSAIMNAAIDPPDAIELARDAMALAAMHHALIIEFVEGERIAGWRSLVVDRREAALAGSAARKQHAVREHARWQRDAEQIWGEHPTKSKSEVARILAQRYRRSSKDVASENTIRQALKKPAAEQCSPSKLDGT